MHCFLPYGRRMNMNYLHKIEILGDSILKGIQVNPLNNRYYTKNDIDFATLSSAYSLEFKNESRFGCTVTKGSRIIQEKIQNGFCCDALVMDFGGNDCDYVWDEISKNPFDIHEPHTPLDLFTKEYTNLIRYLKAHNILPIITTLPPLDSQRFFQWWCDNLNKDNILKFLGSIDQIYKHQESYSNQIQLIAKQEDVPLIDLRQEFLTETNPSSLICEDGTHPNSKGQQKITKAFDDFLRKFTKSGTSAE